MMRAAILLLVAALAGWWYMALPPAANWPASDAVPAPAGVRGAIHVHTSRSDGSGTPGEVALAAARAGLDFVVLTDHGDGTREPDPPQYLEGVLCIDAVEISTADGHLVALGMPVSPYPLAGEARDVIADVERLGGVTFAAHPGAAKAELAWRDWDAQFGGLEWLNGDSEWRDETRWLLARALFAYPLRPLEALALVLDRPADVLRRWDALTQSRRVAAIAAADAHARIGWNLREPYSGGPSARLPGYEQVFRLFSNVLPAVVLSGDPAADAEAVVDAIGSGRVYSVVEAAGGAAAFAFSASSGEGDAGIGDEIAPDGPVTLRVEVPGRTDVRVDLLRNGDPVATGGGASFEHVVDTGEGGTYRVEAFVSGAPGNPPAPWIVSNPIYVGLPHPRQPTPPVVASSTAVQYGDGPAPSWSIETSPASRAAIDVVAATPGTELALRYAIGGGVLDSAFAAFVMPAGPAFASHDRLAFRARADRPMRLSVQLRAPAGGVGKRWQRSVYLDATPRDFAVSFDDFRPAGNATPARPELSAIDSVLFVVDTVNTPVGDSGRIWLDNVRYER